ncbi:MAG TPA: capsular biosynthesis protein [Stellaceae bacterium]|nr:capsular biosynthesis protein [Stellaceae bacterium]
MTSAPRSFLFLQGLASWFFDRLGKALAERGHAVYRVNFNGGDRLFWHLPGAVDYRGRLDDWPAFFDRLLTEKQVTDIILFGDCRPVHRLAIPVARARSVRVHVVEEGYLRSGWITFEEGGVNANSSLPRDPSWYREKAALLPLWRGSAAPPESFRRRASEDVMYTVARLAAAPWYPHYRTHRTRHPLIEYAGWIGRLAGRRRAERRAGETIAALSHIDRPVFVFPLQLDGDYQIRRNSRLGGMLPAIEHVFASFARHAPRNARLLVKLHPLDDGLINWTRVARQVAAQSGVTERVVVIDGGAIETVLGNARAVATINSTVGMAALARGVPVIALGDAIYDLPGLTFQDGLDAFWRAPTPPDAQLYDAFRRVLAARSLIPGGFFSEDGLRLAVEAAAERLEAVGAPRRADIAENATLVETGAHAIPTAAE